MKLWLDDIRDPEHYGKKDWVWVKTAEDAVKAFRSGEVEEASLDHDLTEEQMIRSGMYGSVYEDGQRSGYDVVCWLETHPEFWPQEGCHVHSANPSGAKRMQQVIDKYYGRIC
jgi:hypothetical protein